MKLVSVVVVGLGTLAATAALVRHPNGKFTSSHDEHRKVELLARDIAYWSASGV